MMTNKQFWDRFSIRYSGFIRRSRATYQQICKAMRPFLKRDMYVLELALRNRSAVRAAVSMCPELGGNRLFS